MGNHKGATLIFEQIFIIIFGLIIFVSIVAVMGAFRRGASSSLAGSGFEEVGGMVHSMVVDAYELRRTTTGGKLLLELPPKIGEHDYMIYLYQNNITIKSSGDATIGRSVSIYNIETNLEGNISSSASGKSYVSYNATAIYLETIRE